MPEPDDVSQPPDTPQPRPEIRYRNGLAVLRRVRERPPAWMVYDARADAYVAPGSRLPELRAWAEERGIAEGGRGAEALDAPLLDPREPREYQREALKRWEAAGGRGTVVLPTGAGKTLVALLAVAAGGRGACVVAPTQALVGQWFSQLADAFGAERVGAFYAAEKEVRPVTVTTYHSAFALLERWGERFDLLVLDEAHHLADTAGGEAKAWHDALRIAPAARRLGLTATYPDGRDAELRRLVGPVVYRRAVGEMSEAELAGFALERRFVPLAPEEAEAYRRRTEAYEAYVAARGWADTPAREFWPWFMADTRRSPAARRAFRAWRERERIVAGSAPKLREAERILRLFPAETAVLFCGSAEAAEAVSRRLAVPIVTSETPASERKAVLDAVAAGAVRAVASVRVLDEGWDVPSAKLGVVLGDSTRGSPRQFAQRLGRLLRRQGDSVASLFEIVSAGTHEFYASQRRGRGLRGGPDRQLGLGI
ncbi:MAG TPA: DEAD/DEAH box helicase [Longimicrobiaceae bacterium]|nr:DEAD/DEAH box helicase [Longimicrobiaceae bacterium]